MLIPDWTPIVQNIWENDVAVSYPKSRSNTVSNGL